jgi:hypothetical protein
MIHFYRSTLISPLSSKRGKSFPLQELLVTRHFLMLPDFFENIRFQKGKNFVNSVIIFVSKNQLFKAVCYF